MPEISFSGLLAVAAIAFVAPLALGMAPELKLPSVVVEILAGIAVGPAVLGWVEPDEGIALLSTIGLAFLLFLGGLEIDAGRFRGRFLTTSLSSFGVSLLLAGAVGLALGALGLVEDPMFVAVVLLSTALGLVIPVLKDAGEISTDFGQLTVAGASIADFGAVILLSLLFSTSDAGTGAQLVLLGGFFLLAAAIGLAIARAGRSMRVAAELVRLQDTTAQIRIRGAVLLLMAFLLLAQRLGLEVILAAFIAGAVLRLLDQDASMTHPQFRSKLEAIGFGFFVPFFFVSSGLNFDLAALFRDAGTIALIPVFVAGLVVVRGGPALLYVPSIGRRSTAVAALLQATSLPFIVAATQIGFGVGALDRSTGAALVAAGLVSVLVFPLAALSILRGQGNALSMDDSVAAETLASRASDGSETPDLRPR